MAYTVNAPQCHTQSGLLNGSCCAGRHIPHKRDTHPDIDLNVNLKNIRTLSLTFDPLGLSITSRRGLSASNYNSIEAFSNKQTHAYAYIEKYPHPAPQYVYVTFRYPFLNVINKR